MFCISAKFQCKVLRGEAIAVAIAIAIAIAVAIAIAIARL